MLFDRSMVIHCLTLERVWRGALWRPGPNRALRLHMTQVCGKSWRAVATPPRSGENHIVSM